MFKKLLSMALAAIMVMGMGTTAFATETPTAQATIVIDDVNERVATYEGTTARFDKDSNTMYITENGETYSFSMDVTTEQETPSTYANKVIRSESVALHRYEYVKTDSGSYYWGVDIPSYSINPNNWCGWLSVWDDGSTEGNYGSDFADYIEAAQDDEHTIAAYGGATAVAVIVGLVTKNPAYSASSFKAACAAAGVIVSVGILDAASSYYNNLDNARENYFAIRNIIG